MNEACVQEQPYASWRYEVTFETCMHPDIGTYHTYGIEVSGPDCVYVVHDISVCRQEVEQLAARFNRYQLSPIHMEEMVEDFFAILT